MTVYTEIGTFGGVAFALGDVTVSRQPSSLKTNIGKTYVEKPIPLRNTVDIILNIKGIIDGRSRTSSQTVSEAIEADRTSLIALEDGHKHSYSDGKHSNLDMVIVPNSLIWNDLASRESGNPNEFTVTLKEWK